MKLLIFEHGELVTDIQNYIEEFSGDLYEYDKVQLNSFKNSTDRLELISSGFTDSGDCLYYIYFSNLMSKLITQYVIKLED